MKLPVAVGLALLALTTLRAEPVKVACVGDSITLGVGVGDRARRSYPAVLGQMLGRGYRVGNFGFSGTTLLASGKSSYRKTAAFRDATKFKPDIVIIELGTNDSKPRNWDGHEKDFLPDYETLIAHFAGLRGKPKIFLCLPPPSFQTAGDDIREAILERQRRMLRKLATAKRLPLIDLRAPLKAHPEWLPDGVHPNEAGAAVIARTVARAIQK